MNESGTGRGEQYSRLRQEFDALAIEDKAVFLLEATMTTLVRGIETFGRMVGDELERLMRRAEAEAAEAEAEAEAAEAEAAAAAGTPAPNVTPEPPEAGASPLDSDIPGPRSPKRPGPRNGGDAGPAV